MTYKGAINQLYEMRDNTLMPEFLKPYFDKIIETLTADVRENVKGEWIFDGQRHRGGINWCHCSVCGSEENADYAIVQGVNFCPNCGADMRGDKLHAECI